MRKLLLLSLCAACAHAAGPARDELAPLVAEAVRFPTTDGNPAAHAAQKEWLLRTAARFGLVARDAGRVTEIELPGPAGAPVLGLVVHGDVQPVEEKAWTVPPFAGLVRGGQVIGRGAADDKGAIVQALFAMQALRAEKLTHTVRLLVGSDEESNNLDMAEYLAKHEAPAYTLVLDSAFPVVVGEKAWDGLAVVAPPESPGPGDGPLQVEDLEAGLSPSIVPDRARLVLTGPNALLSALSGRVRAKTPAEGTWLEANQRQGRLELVVHGKAAHGGVNLEGGRNALVSLARLVEGELPKGGAADLLAFARLAGSDLRGAALNLPAHADPAWDGWAVNVAMVTRHGAKLPQADGRLTLIVNLRRPPPLTGPQSRELLFAQVRRLAPTLTPLELWFKDEPLIFDREAPLVRRLMDDYARATGERVAPAISGGGTYAKRIPRAIAFGMWFPGKPYPGHDVDEQVPVADLQRGLDVLTFTLRDLATSPPIAHPFERQEASTPMPGLSRRPAGRP